MTKHVSEELAELLDDEGVKCRNPTRLMGKLLSLTLEYHEEHELGSDYYLGKTETQHIERAKLEARIGIARELLEFAADHHDFHVLAGCIGGKMQIAEDDLKRMEETNDS